MSIPEEWSTIQEIIIERDGGACQANCGCTARLTVHHIIPRAEGGTNDPFNLVTLCTWCHDEIEETKLRTIEMIRVYTPRWHERVAWYPTSPQPKPHWHVRVPKLPPVKKIAERPAPIERICVGCGCSFRINHPSQRWCSRRCRDRGGCRGRSKIERQRGRHVLKSDTVATIRRLKETASFRELAQRLGFDEPYATTLCSVYHNKPGVLTSAGEHQLRMALGLPDCRDARRSLHASPQLFARLRQQQGDLTQEAYLTQLADLWDACEGGKHVW